MRKSLTTFFQILTVVLGISVFIFMLWKPHLEGRNVGATFFQIYFNDPFLSYVYIGSIPFFVGLYQIFRLLGYAGRNELFLETSVKILRTIKYCAMILIAFVLGAEAYFFIVQRGSEDIAGGVVMGLFVIFVSTIVVAVTILLGMNLQKNINKKIP